MNWKNQWPYSEFVYFCFSVRTRNFGWCAKTDVVYCKAARSMDVYAAVSRFNCVSKQEYFRALNSPIFPAHSV